MIKFIINMIYFLTGAIFGYCIGKEKIPFWLFILDSLVYIMIYYLVNRTMGEI